MYYNAMGMVYGIVFIPGDNNMGSIGQRFREALESFSTHDYFMPLR